MEQIMGESMGTVLLIDDEKGIREALKETLEISGFKVMDVSTPGEALHIIRTKKIHLVLSDIQLGHGMNGHELLTAILAIKPEVPVIFITAYGTVKSAVKAMLDGAVDYLEKPFEPEVLVNTVEKHILKEIPEYSSAPVVEDPKSRVLFQKASQVAKTDATVLITGESGTGKEILAKYIHQQSARRAEPFIAINCAAIPENLLEATMFGYEQGAFTGANRSLPGKFEQAQGGTILLDEVSEMPLMLQSKFLRVLQEHEVERIGSKKTIVLDVRVIATSNRDLIKAVREGLFREDLYYRLCVFPLECLPLRLRKKDILPLTEQLMARLSKKSGDFLIKISEEAKQQLLAYAWPGNVRELENTLQRAMILQTEMLIKPEHLAINVAFTPVQSVVKEEQQSASLDDGLMGHELQLIQDALRQSGGSKKQAAEILGISPRTLRYKVAKLREKEAKMVLLVE